MEDDFEQRTDDQTMNESNLALNESGESNEQVRLTLGDKKKRYNDREPVSFQDQPDQYTVPADIYSNKVLHEK